MEVHANDETWKNNSKIVAPEVVRSDKSPNVVPYVSVVVTGSVVCVYQYNFVIRNPVVVIVGKPKNNARFPPIDVVRRQVTLQRKMVIKPDGRVENAWRLQTACGNDKYVSEFDGGMSSDVAVNFFDKIGEIMM
jgi:hypothetical protein